MPSYGPSKSDRANLSCTFSLVKFRPRSPSRAAFWLRFRCTQCTDLARVVVPGILIDDGDGSGQYQSGGIACRGCRSRCRHEYLVAEAYPVVRQGLAFRNACTDELDDLRRLGELAVMEVVAGFDLCEVDHGDLVGFKFLFVWRLLRDRWSQAGICLPRPAATTPARGRRGKRKE